MGILGYYPPIMENQMEKKMENEMEIQTPVLPHELRINLEFDHAKQSPHSNA